MSTEVTTSSPVGRSPSDAVIRQAQALEVSGWGERFTFVQPRNLCFWVYVTLIGVGVVSLVATFAPEAEFAAEPMAVALLMIVLLGAAWLWWFHHLDRWEHQPLGLVVAGLAFGAIGTTYGFVKPANDAMLSMWAKLFGQEWADDWGPAMTAPFTEEAAKLCGFVLLMGLAPRLVRTANDGLLLGAFVGLGFMLGENVLYALTATHNNFGVDSTGSAVQITLVRVAASAISHPLYSALVCCGFVYLVGTVAQRRRIGLGLVLFLAGPALHFLWDAQGGFATIGGEPGVALGMFVPPALGFIALYLAFRSANPREHQFVRDILAPEVEAGTLTDEQVEAALNRKARKAYVRAGHGHRAKRARKHLRSAVLDLTRDIAEARGADTAAVMHSRGEVTRLRGAADQASPASAEPR